MGRRDSIGLLSLDTLCLGLFLECDSTRRVGVVFFFLVFRGKRESYLVWLGLFVGLRGNGDFISRKLEFQIGTEEECLDKIFRFAFEQYIFVVSIFIIRDLVN